MGSKTERNDEMARYFAPGRDRRRIDRLLEAPLQSVMTLRPPVFVPARATVRTAARHMATSDVGAVLVTGDDGGIVGVLRARDLLVHVTATGADAGRVRVASCMSRVRDVISATTTVAEAFHMLVGVSEPGYLPVISSAGEPIACVSAGDVAACLADGLPEHLANLPPYRARAVARTAAGA